MFSPVHIVGLDCALKHEVDRAVLKRKESVFVCVLVWLPLHKITSGFCCDAVKGFDTVIETAGPGGLRVTSVESPQQIQACFTCWWAPLCTAGMGGLVAQLQWEEMFGEQERRKKS